MIEFHTKICVIASQEKTQIDVKTIFISNNKDSNPSGPF
jgi:hypothetical protein